MAQLPRLFRDVQPADALPLLEGQNRRAGLRGEGGFRGDGGREEDDDGTAFEPRRPLMETVARYPPEHEDPQVAGKHPYKRPLRGTVLSSLPKYRKLGKLFGEARARLPIVDISPEEWRSLFTDDAWNLTLRAIRHACGPSCWKYNKHGDKLCRHQMVHFLHFPGHWQDKKKRRNGKRLRNVITIEQTEEGGMKGRIYTFQDHPYEGPTNYVGLTCLRCNLDVQDLRRVLVDFAEPPLPSTGPKDNWSWMSVDAPTSDFDFESCDWPKVYDELVDLEEKIGTCVSAHAISSLSGNVPDEDLNTKACKSIFN